MVRHLKWFVLPVINVITGLCLGKGLLQSVMFSVISTVIGFIALFVVAVCMLISYMNEHDVVPSSTVARAEFKQFMNQPIIMPAFFLGIMIPTGLLLSFSIWEILVFVAINCLIEVGHEALVGEKL